MEAVRRVVWTILLFTVCKQTHAQTEFCQDVSEQCPIWASEDRCTSSPEFMTINCPVSCNSCVDPECYDKSDRCSSMAAKGNCLTQPVYMEFTCPRSCGSCPEGAILGATRPRPLSIVSPDNECGRGISSTLTNSGSNTQRLKRQVIFPDSPVYAKFILNDPRLSDPAFKSVVLPKQAPASLTAEIPSTVEPPTNISDVDVTDTFCGAIPISDRFIITAAHCVLNSERAVHTVRLGELDFADDNEENSRPADYQVQQIIVHPDFKYQTVERYNDLALILTNETIVFNEFVFPYCLVDDRLPPKTLVTGAGFGFVNETHQSSRLQEVELELVDTTECENVYRREGVEIRLRQRYPQLLNGTDIICAAYPERDACKGDSGGPLFLNRDDRRFVMGIVGAGVACGNGGSVLPGLYISIADHVDFIDSVLFGNL